MKDTSNFRTKTDFKPRENGKIDGTWPVALDIGYSAVKLFSPNIVSRFPSYAKRIDEGFNFVGNIPWYSILYRNDDAGEKWIVGQMAQDLMSSADTSDSEQSLYGRDRYGHAMFKVVAETGLGIGLMENEFGGPKNDKIVIQTGLPEKYMRDEYDLRDVLSGHHNFSLKVGNDDWKNFSVDIENNNIFVMSQPKGTLFSVSISQDGRFHKDAAKYLSSSVIVFDPGFGTLDIFPVRSGTVGQGETYPDLGMERILSDTTKAIWENLRVNVPVPAMQKYLATGKVRQVDKKKMVSKDVPFGDFLARASENVCNEAIERMKSAFTLGDYNYMIITGGTGAAWYNQIVEKFKDWETLKIIQGNQNDDLPFVYSNVRGYYYFRLNSALYPAAKAA